MEKIVIRSNAQNRFNAALADKKLEESPSHDDDSSVAFEEKEDAFLTRQMEQTFERMKLEAQNRGR